MDDDLDLDRGAALLAVEREALYGLIRRGGILGLRTGARQWLVRRDHLEAYRDGREQVW